jgi:hypothetical protein
MAGFQRSVNSDPSPAVEGDFASANPRASMLAGAGALVAGPLGVTVGRFAWALNSTGVVTTAKPGGAARIGFVGRNQTSLITAWLGEASMVVQSGINITLHRSGDFWGRFAAGAAIGQKVFASDTDGTLLADAAGATPVGYTETDWFVETTAAATELAKISTRN